MKIATALVALLPAVLWAGDGTHFELQATFVPSKAGAEAAVAVIFTPKDPDVKINETPAPRLKLDASQSVLAAKPPSAPAKSSGTETPDITRYLDLNAPVRFPVTLGAAATKGTHLVKGSVAYFYCSKREGWCRKGTTDVEIPVLIR